MGGFENEAFCLAAGYYQRNRQFPVRCTAFNARNSGSVHPKCGRIHLVNYPLSWYEIRIAKKLADKTVRMLHYFCDANPHLDDYL